MRSNLSYSVIYKTLLHDHSWNVLILFQFYKNKLNRIFLSLTVAAVESGRVFMEIFSHVCTCLL